MLKRIFFYGFCLVLVFSLAACAEKEKIKKETKETKEARPATITSDMFGTDRACLVCHEQHHEEWESSMHRRAFEDMIFRKAYELADKEAGEKIAKFCDSCHTPIGLMSGEVPPIDGSGLSEISKIGVQCDFCHTISEGRIGNKGFQPGYTSSPGNLKRGPLKDAASPIHQVAYSEFHTKSEFCGMCHNVNHPVNGLPLEKTFTEWKDSPYNTGNPKTETACQHCMMGFRSGKAALGSKDRPRVARHYFVGANVAMAQMAGATEHQKIAEDRLKSAAEIKIVSPTTFKAGVENPVEVDVTNVGCGHYLPTGLTEAREMWIDLKITDSAGTIVYQSGALDAEGNIDPNAVLYHTVLGDKAGKPTEKVWEAVKILSDKRIPPKQMSKETYQFNLSAGSRGPYAVVATLRYRSAPQHLIDAFFGKGTIVMPVTEMCSASVTVQ